MLMPSQSPSSTTTIQTLPSDPQQQQQRKQRREHLDTLNSEKNSEVRREKSMEFDDDVRFLGNIPDDINNNSSTFETTDERSKPDSSESSKQSIGDDERPLTITLPSSSSGQISSPESHPGKEHAIAAPAIRRTTRPTANRRSTGGDNDSSPSINMNEPDPNVFLISSDTNSHNTIRKTKHDVKRFVMYVDEQFGEQKALHTLSAESLCGYLKHYFENTTKFDGTQYEPDTLRSFLLSIERYLKSKSYEYNLMESPLFLSCRQVILNKREQWRKLGGGNHANHHHHHHHHHHPTKPTMPPLNLKNMTLFDRTKPDGLLLEIYIHVSKLCPDKLLSVQQLLWGDIALIDERYLVCQHHKSDGQPTRLNAIPSQPSVCPVQAYRLYATRRPPQCNSPQSPFFLLPRASTVHPIWYKTTAAGKSLEQILQQAMQRTDLSKQSSPPAGHSRTSDPPSAVFPGESSSPVPMLNGKRTEAQTSSPHVLPSAKRLHATAVSVQPLNLSIAPTEDDSGTSSSSPAYSSSNDTTPTVPAHSSSLSFNKTLSSSIITDGCHKPLSSSSASLIWDESVTDILLAVAKQRDTRLVKINTLRTYLEEKLGVVEFLCLYRGFKSEPKLTFHATPWEHYQRFLPVLFTLLALDNTTI